MRAKQCEESQLYLVGRRGWPLTVHPCQMPELWHAIQWQDRAVQPNQYHHLFCCFVRDRFLFVRRADISEYLLEQLIILVRHRKAFVFFM